MIFYWTSCQSGLCTHTHPHTRARTHTHIPAQRNLVRPFYLCVHCITSQYSLYQVALGSLSSPGEKMLFVELEMTHKDNRIDTETPE